MMPEGISLNKFVMSQATEWSKYWCPSNVPKEGVTRALHQLWHAARDIRNLEDAFDIDYTKHKTYFDPKCFYQSVSSYKKTSLGSDMWQAKSDLANLPFVALGGITDDIDAQIKACTIPHQQLLNVNALLGKQEGCRTISKTPMVWRMIGKCDTTVKNWKSLEAGSFDTAVRTPPHYRLHA